MRYTVEQTTATEFLVRDAHNKIVGTFLDAQTAAEFIIALWRAEAR